MSAAAESPPAPRSPSTGDRLKRALRFVFGVALFVVVLRWIAPDWAELAARVEFNWRWALLGLVGTTLASFATAARWQVLAELMGGTRLPFVAYFHGLVLTRLLGQFTSTIGMDLVGRGAALKAAGSERGLGHAAMQVVLERLFDALLPLVLLVWALSVRQDWIGLGPGPALVLFALVFTAVAIPVLGPAARISLRLYLWLRPRAKRASARIQRGLAGLLGRDRPAAPADPAAAGDSQTATIEVPAVSLGLSTKVAGLSLLRFATVVLQFWGFAGAVGVELSWDQITTATPVAQLAGMLGLTPGGLGILEGGWFGGLGWVGVDATAIGLFVLAQRVGVISNFGILTGLSTLVTASRRAASLPGSGASGV